MICVWSNKYNKEEKKFYNNAINKKRYKIASATSWILY